MHKFTGPDAVYPQILRELVEEVAMPLSVLFENCGLEKRKQNPHFQKEKKRRHRASLTLVPQQDHGAASPVNCEKAHEK